MCYAKRGFIGTVFKDCISQIELDATYQSFGFTASQPSLTLNAPESTDPVTDNVSLISGVALRYASALLDLAEEQGATVEVEKGLDQFEKLLQESSDLDRLIKSPVFSADAQTKALSAILEKAGIAGLTANFVKLVAQNRRLFAVPGMIQAFRAQLAAKRGEVTAAVTSATELSAEHVAALQEALNASTGKNVKIVVKVDSSILGGLIVKIGSRMIDTSLRTKLNSLKFAMKEVG